MIKAAFFDVDGTIVSFKDHKLIPSAIEAINKLREKNIKVFVATGRALFQLDYILDNLKLDGLVTLNGCNSFIDSEEIFRAHLHKDDLYRLSEYLEKNNNPFSCNLITKNDIYINAFTKEVLDMYREFNITVPKIVNFKEYINKNYSDILQINLFVNKEKEEELMKEIFINSEATRWADSFADINCKGITKITGVLKIIEHFNIDISETIAFGDGGNDFTMIQNVGIGVAMGNANEHLKEVADYITDNVDDDGVYKALKHFNIIE